MATKQIIPYEERWDVGLQSQFSDQVKFSNLELMISCRIYGKDYSLYEQWIEPTYS